MSEQVLISLKASRIADVQAAIEATEKELAEVRKSLEAADAKLKAATTEAKRKQAEVEKRTAEANVEAAQTKLNYERDELSRLLGKVRWYTAIPSTAIPYLFFGLLGGIVLYTILTGLSDKILLGTLQYIPSARGLITFLVTLVTVTIALILALSTIVSNSPDRTERFKDGKDLLFALIGVLGTIIGFYFGQMDPDSPELNLAPMVVTNESPAVGEKFNLISFATGGDAPYTFKIAFDPQVMEPITVESSNGLLNQEVDTSAFAQEDEQKIAITINVTDSQGTEISSEAKSITLKPKRADSNR